MFWFATIFLVVYSALVIWFYIRHYRPSVVQLDASSASNPRYTLARRTMKVLSFFQAIIAIAVALWLPLLIVLIVSSRAPGHTPGDVTIPARMHMDLAQLDGVALNGVRNQFVTGTVELNFPSPNAVQYLLFGCTSVVKGLLTLFVLLQLRNILASYCNGEPFASHNSLRLRRIGIIVVAAYIIGPMWQWFLSASVINAISFSTPAIGLTPWTSGSWLGIFVGVGVLILAGVIHEAETLQSEQRLTI